jgi:microsomal dipeptidase-like Zn-dependent dipeptidase
MSRVLSILLLALVCLPARAAIAPDLSVELHAHLFMKVGLWWTFLGDFDEPMRVSSWEDRFSSQTNAETVDKSRIGILVLSLYANPAVGVNPRKAIHEQMNRAEKFVREHPEWVIARDPNEAQAALESGKRVIVYSLEGASEVLDTDADIAEFVDKRGIRIVTLLHLTDDQYGGVAFLGGYQSLGTPLAFLDTLLEPQHDSNGIRINGRGLSDEGARLAQKLIDHHVWIDLSHCSDHSQERLVPLMLANGQPLLYTHTTLRRYRKAERSISDQQLDEVRLTRGIVGLVPSEDVIGETPVPASWCPKGCSPKACKGSIFALGAQYAEVARVIGADATDLGTDYNGGMRHLKPACGTGTTLDKGGLWHIGQQSEMWSAMARMGAPVPGSLSQNVERFIETWRRAWNHAGAK